jgi:hypothetical protein
MFDLKKRRLYMPRYSKDHNPASISDLAPAIYGLTYYNNLTVAYAARPPALPDGCRRKKKSTFAHFRQQIKIDKLQSAIEERVNPAQILDEICLGQPLLKQHVESARAKQDYLWL